MTYVENYNIEELYNEEINEKPQEDENTFLDWLYLSKKEHFNKHYKIKKQRHLISNFIQTAPKIQPVKAALNSIEIDLETKPVNEKKTDLIVSETLAKVYYGQKKYHLAIETYRKLRIVYPEKSSFFASLIKEIEKDLSEGKA